MSPEAHAAAVIGSVLGGAYQITRLIGEGGMGWVYEGRHLRLNKPVAIKLMARELAANAEALARFHREAEVTSRLGHPHLVSVLDFGATDSGAPYLVMEYLDGEDLERRIRREGRLTLETSVEITKQIASAVGAAHAEGIVHRDLKSANVFLVRVRDENDFVKVLDFGVSKIKAARTRLTRATAVMGTPEYMSPEQATGLIEEIDHRTDQWALGCIVWEMLSGYAPFMADDLGALFYQIIHQDPHALTRRAPGLPAAVEPVLRRALAKRPTDRFPSIKEFARTFQAAALGQAVELTPAPVATDAVQTGDTPVVAVSRSSLGRTVGYGEVAVELKTAVAAAAQVQSTATAVLTIDEPAASPDEDEDLADKIPRHRLSLVIFVAVVAVGLAALTIAVWPHKSTPVTNLTAHSSESRAVPPKVAVPAAPQAPAAPKAILAEPPKLNGESTSEEQRAAAVPVEPSGAGGSREHEASPGQERSAAKRPAAKARADFADPSSLIRYVPLLFQVAATMPSLSSRRLRQRRRHRPWPSRAMTTPSNPMIAPLQRSLRRCGSRATWIRSSRRRGVAARRAHPRGTSNATGYV